MAKGEKWDVGGITNVRQDEPPITHARHRWDNESGTLVYEYNGFELFRLRITTSKQIGYRHGSDGNIQSSPFLQQVYIMLEEHADDPIIARITFTISEDGVVMRPHRAASEQAILAQVGRPLISGVNGLYDIAQDLLIDWHGQPWSWLADELTYNTEGNLTAEMEVMLSLTPWIINIRPHYYRTHLGYAYHKPWKRRPNQKAVAGWCSWEAYRHGVNEDHIKKISVFMAENLKAYGLEYIQIDDGFEPTPIPADPKGSIADTWLSTNEQFPSGHRGIVKTIRQSGLVPGIWGSCSLSNMDLAQEQPEILFQDQKGKPMEGDWVGLVLDCTPGTLDKHVKPCFSGLREFGYDYFKIDQIRHLFMDGFMKAAACGLITNDEAEKRFRAYLESIREGIGPDAYLLSSWGVLSEVAGLADSCRISMDANPTWPGLRMQMVELARWFHAQRILFTLDPDHVCARGDKNWVRSLLSLVSLSGGLLMLSDALEEYNDERLELIRKCLPPLKTFTGETGPLDPVYPAYSWTKLHGFAVPRETPVKAEGISLQEAMNLAGQYPTMHDDHPLSSLWGVHLKIPGRVWCVMGRFATVPLRDSILPVQRLGLLKEQRYHAFDFWAQEYLGIVSREISCPALELGCCQVVALTPVNHHPQLLGSSRHVSMDSVSVLSERWDNGMLFLELEGIVDQKETYWFYLPEGYILDELVGEGLNPSANGDENIIAVRVIFEEGRGCLTLNFKK